MKKIRLNKDGTLYIEGFDLRGVTFENITVDSDTYMLCYNCYFTGYNEGKPKKIETLDYRDPLEGAPPAMLTDKVNELVKIVNKLTETID